MSAVVVSNTMFDYAPVFEINLFEHTENCASLGWLIDATTRKVYVYHSNAKVETLENPTEISGEPLLQVFVLNFQEIWD